MNINAVKKGARINFVLSQTGGGIVKHHNKN